MNLTRIGAQSGLRFARRLSAGLATTAVLGSGLIAITTTPAAAVSRDSIVSVAQSQLNNASRNHEQPLGSGCNYYTGYFRTWKPAAGCPATDGVQWRDSDWCADFSKYVWKNAGVPYADVPETSGGVLTGWASSFKDYGTTHGTWHTRASGYTPQPGDALVFDWDQNGVIDHVGIVKSASGSTVYTIEGNSGDRIKENSYSRTNIDIVGYSSPVGAGDIDDPLPVPGTPSGGPAVVHEGFVSMFTRNAADGHIQETYLPGIGSPWYSQDISADAGTPASATKPVAVVHEGYTSIFTVNASNGHLQETYLPRVGAAWVTQDLSVGAGTPAAANVTPAVVVHEGYTSVFT
ncbi:CHAP domain-containing protein, partial [Acrocarpospora macrocephala]